MFNWIKNKIESGVRKAMFKEVKQESIAGQTFDIHGSETIDAVSPDYVPPAGESVFAADHVNSISAQTKEVIHYGRDYKPAEFNGDVGDGIRRKDQPIKVKVKFDEHANKPPKKEDPGHELGHSHEFNPQYRPGEFANWGG